jgi:hypothetical protein
MAQKSAAARGTMLHATVVLLVGLAQDSSPSTIRGRASGKESDSVIDGDGDVTH